MEYQEKRDKEIEDKNLNNIEGPKYSIELKTLMKLLKSKYE